MEFIRVVLLLTQTKGKKLELILNFGELVKLKQLFVYLILKFVLKDLLRLGFVECGNPLMLLCTLLDILAGSDLKILS